MGLFSSIAKLALDVVTTPIAVVSDVITLGGAVNETESKVKEKGEQLAEDWDEIRKKLTD